MPETAPAPVGVLHWTPFAAAEALPDAELAPCWATHLGVAPDPGRPGAVALVVAGVRYDLDGDAALALADALLQAAVAAGGDDPR